MSIPVWAGRLLACAVAALAAPASTARAEVVDRVAVVVDGDAILLSEVEDRAGYSLPRGGDEKRRHAALREAADELVSEKLVSKQVAAEGLEPTAAEIDAAVDEVKHNNRIDDKGLDAALAQQGLTRSTYRQMLVRQLGRMKLVEGKVRARVQVTDDDVKVRYTQMSADLKPDEELHVRDVFVPAGDDRAAAKAKAEAARKRVAAGEDFEMVARETGGPLADDGGDLGWLKRGAMIPEIDKAAATLATGAVSGVVESDAGFHVVKVEDRRRTGGARPLSEAREELRQQILAERLSRATEEYVQELRRAADVEFHLP